MALLTLGQASDECGKHKSTILDAIRKGRLSAKRDEKNQWQIDPAELFRVYPQHQTEHQNDHHNRTPGNHPNTDLIDALKAQIEQLTSQVKREQENADNWKNQATLLLTHQPEPAIKKENSRLWLKLFGRKTNG
jgi:molecular chaperone GrpE (heat shock protein)